MISPLKFISPLALKLMFGLSLIMLIFISGVAYKHAVSLVESMDWVVHSQKVSLESERLMSYLKDAETGQRGYILTHDAIFLEPFNGSELKVENSFKELKKLAADNPAQKQNLDSLHTLIVHRFMLFQESVEKSFGNVSSPEGKLKLDASLLMGKNMMDSIRMVVTQMDEIETVLSEQRQNAYKEEISFTPLYALILITFSLIIFIASYIKMNTDLETLQKGNAELILSNELLEQAERVNCSSSYLFDPEAKLLVFSDNFYRLLDYDPGDFPATTENFRRFVHPDDIVIVEEADEKLKTGTVDPVEAHYRMYNKKGELLYFKSVATMFKNSEHKLQQIGTITDVTAPHLANVKLKERNEQLEFTTKLLQDAEQVGHVSSWLWNLETNAIDLSDNYYRLLGHQVGAFKPTIEKFRSFVHPDDQHILTHIAEALRSGEPSVTAVYRVIHQDGTHRYFKSIARVFKNNENNALVTGTLTDVTESHLSNLALKEKNRELLRANNLLQYAEHVGKFSSWMWNMETNKILRSDNYFILMGHQPQAFEPTIDTFRNYIHPDDLDFVNKTRENVLAGEKTAAITYRVIRADGVMIYCESIAQVLTNNEGEKIMIGVLRDITAQQLINIDLEEKNRDLERSNKELASFNHVASHDLQEPLRKIQLFISHISEKEGSHISETGKEYLDKIKGLAQKMRSLIDDLLLFSRLNKSGTTEYLFEEKSLAEIAHKAEEELIEIITDKKALIEIHALPTLRVIPFQIQQLFFNLLSNALKYRHPERASHITITAEKIYAADFPELKLKNNKEYFAIRIADNGIGFSEAYADKIFELFYRLPHEENFSGTGIGLSICKKIVENHNGFIFAKSEKGEGSVFTFVLPE